MQIADPQSAHVAGPFPFISSLCVVPGHFPTHSYQLHNTLAVARSLSKSDSAPDNSLKLVILNFLVSIPSSFNRSFWPPPFDNHAITSFFTDFCEYLYKATGLSSEFAAEVAEFMQIAVAYAITFDADDAGISRLFLLSLLKHFPPPILSSHAGKLLNSLLSQFAMPILDTFSQEELIPKDRSNSGFEDFRIASFEESVENLEKKITAYQLIRGLLDKFWGEPKQWHRALTMARRQVQYMPAFFKIRNLEWSEEKINARLSFFRAATLLAIDSLSLVGSDGKAARKFWLESLVLFAEAAKACLLSDWQKLQMCKDLFSALVDAMGIIALDKFAQNLHIFHKLFKVLVMIACAQADSGASSLGAIVEKIVRIHSKAMEGATFRILNHPTCDTFVRRLAYCIDEKVGTEKQPIPLVQLNLIQFVADLTVALNDSDLVDMVLSCLIEVSENSDASSPAGPLQLQLLDAVVHVASSDFEESHRKAVSFMTRTYLNIVLYLESAESKNLEAEASAEPVETLAAAFLLIASRLKTWKLRLDLRHSLLSLCSDVGLAAESKNGWSGACFLGPLLPAVAEICSDLDSTINAEPSLLKLFRNLWFYVVLFGLAPPVQSSETATELIALNSAESVDTIPLEAVAGPYKWKVDGLPLLNVLLTGLLLLSVKWLEDELELNALHKPGKLLGCGIEKVGRAALSAALGGRMKVAEMDAISGARAIYLLAVAFLEIIRFSSNGSTVDSNSSLTVSISGLTRLFEYLKTPNPMPSITQCLTAIIHLAFETVETWLERAFEIFSEAEILESTLCGYASFLIRSMFSEEQSIRDIAANLLTALSDKFPEILWKFSCLDLLLFPVESDLSSVVHDAACIEEVWLLHQQVVQEWIVKSLSYAPCTTQGLLQESLRKANTWGNDGVVSLLTEIRIGMNESGCWSGMRTANIPAVMAAAAAASGVDVRLDEAFSLEVLSSCIVGAKAKGANLTAWNSLTGMQPLNDEIIQAPLQYNNNSLTQQPHLSDNLFVQQLQQVADMGKKGVRLDKTLFRWICFEATAFLLSKLEYSSKSGPQMGFPQLLTLLCQCPAYIVTPDTMAVGVSIWTWLVSAAPQLGPHILSKLVDAWEWTIEAEVGLFASEMTYSGGPAGKLRPQGGAGEQEQQSGIDPVEQIIAQGLWLGFFIDRFEVIHYSCSYKEQQDLFRLLRRSTEALKLSRHPAAAGTFFTLMLFGLKFCVHQSRSKSLKFDRYMLEDLIYRAAFMWFAHEPERFERANTNFAQTEAQSVSLFVKFLQNDRLDDPESDLEISHENECSAMEGYTKHHPVWGLMDRENYAVERKKRKELLLMLSQHEADRLEVLAQPSDQHLFTRKWDLISGNEEWAELARTAFSVDPRIASSLVSRFRTNIHLENEVTRLMESLG